MKKLIVSLLLLSALCVTVAASVFPENWTDTDRENFKALYGDKDIKEFFEIADLEGFSSSAVVDFLNSRQVIIAPGLSVDSEGYLVDSKELEKALEEEKKRQEELLASKEEQLVITVPEKTSDAKEKAPLKTSVIIAVCAILLSGIFTVAVTGKKKK